MPENGREVQSAQRNLAAESGEVLKRFDTWKEEVGAALHGRESGQALYLLTDGTLRNCEIECTVSRTDHRISARAFVQSLRLLLRPLPCE